MSLLEQRSVTNALIEWVIAAKPSLADRGVSLGPVTGEPPQGSCVHMDGANFVGTICFWEPDVLELQFIFVSTGTTLLETIRASSAAEINSSVNATLEKLKNRQ